MSNLKEYRTRKGLTQHDVALRIGVSTRSYQFYESGERLPDVQTAIRIAQVLGVFDLKELWSGNFTAL